MKNEVISTLLGITLIVFLTACGSTPTTSSTESPNLREEGTQIANTIDLEPAEEEESEITEEDLIEEEPKVEEEEPGVEEESVTDVEEEASVKDEFDFATPEEIAARQEESTELVNTSTNAIGETVDFVHAGLLEQLPTDINVCYSPFSIVSAILCADLGAKGNTKTSIENALGTNDLDDVLDDYRIFIRSNSSDLYTFENSNSLWISKDLQMSEEYNDDLYDKYKIYLDAQVKTVDFRNDTSSVQRQITEYVKDHTHGLISDYQSFAGPSTALDIINTVYFKAKWWSTFKPNATYLDTFHGAKQDYEVQFMHQTDEVHYYEYNNEVKAISLPYRGESDLVMDLITTIDESRDIVPYATKEVLTDILQELDSVEDTSVYISLPKFSIDASLDNLKDVLEQIGFEELFFSASDFSGLAQDLHVSDIEHKAVVKVDEEGTEAAAVTEMLLETTSARNYEEPKEFNANHSFIFQIRDRQTNTILFFGRVINVTPEMSF